MQSTVSDETKVSRGGDGEGGREEGRVGERVASVALGPEPRQDLPRWTTTTTSTPVWSSWRWRLLHRPFCERVGVCTALDTDLSGH